MEEIQDLRHLPVPNDDGDIIFSMCSLCGCLVGDMNYHKSWHKKLADHDSWHKELDGLVDQVLAQIRGYTR